MAEFCRDCFIDIWNQTQNDIDNITMSDDIDFCEGCGCGNYYVLSVVKDYNKNIKIGESYANEIIYPIK